MSVPVHILAALFRIQLPPAVPGKAEADDPSGWSPVTHVGDSDTVPGSCFDLNQPYYGHFGSEPVDGNY